MPKNLKLKAARAEKDMPQAALAEAVGVSRQTINAIEKGEYNPTINLCRAICKALGNPERLLTHVADRKGHDMRYAIDPTKIHNELGWLPETKFADGIKKTIKWYLDNKEWWETIISGEYQNYYEKMYGNREEVKA